MQSEFVNSTAIINNEPRRDPKSPNAQPWLDEQMMKSKYGVTRYILPLFHLHSQKLCTCSRALLLVKSIPKYERR
jgi:hypothetical protein